MLGNQKKGRQHNNQKHVVPIMISLIEGCC